MATATQRTVELSRKRWAYAKARLCVREASVGGGDDGNAMGRGREIRRERED
jgi:hypothetical protein